MPLVKMPESENWDVDINVPDTSDSAYGGINGNMFVGLKSLANRSLWLKNAIAALSSNTGDETSQTIKTKLGITTLSGTNTGDETSQTIKSKLSISTFFSGLFGSADASALRASISAAPLASPSFTGTPMAPTPAVGTNTTQIANTAFVATAITNLIAGSPEALNTLKELAAAMGNDPNFATTVTNSISTKQPLSQILTDFVNSQKLPMLNLVNSDANSIAWSCVAVVGANVSNLPSDSQFLLTHYLDSTNIHQICYTRVDGGIFTRRNTGSGWTTWTGTQKTLGNNYGVPNYVTPTVFTYVDGTVYGCSVAMEVKVLLNGAFINYISARVGATTSPATEVARAGDDINANTKNGYLSFIVPAGWYFTLTAVGVAAWENVYVVGYPLQRI